MSRMKDLIVDIEMLNELGIKITHEDILNMMESENLTESEVVEELKNRMDNRLADIQADEMDNQIRDTYPDDDYFEMHEPDYHLDTMFGRIVYDDL